MINVDLVENKEADYNTLTTGKESLAEQGEAISASVASVLGSDKLHGIFCVAGGWAGGNSGSEGNNGWFITTFFFLLTRVLGFLQSAELMISQSVNSSLIAANLASKHLQP